MRVKQSLSVSGYLDADQFRTRTFGWRQAAPRIPTLPYWIAYSTTKPPVILGVFYELLTFSAAFWSKALETLGEK